MSTFDDSIQILKRLTFSRGRAMYEGKRKRELASIVLYHFSVDTTESAPDNASPLLLQTSLEHGQHGRIAASLGNV